MVETERQPAKKRGIWFWVLVALAVLAGIGLIGSMDDDAGTRAAGPAADGGVPAGESQAQAAPANVPEMSAAEFAALRSGMTYDEAVAIVGSPGELISENEIAGIRTSMYQWEGEGSFGANANAMFQNGELIQKSQFGLE